MRQRLIATLISYDMIQLLNRFSRSTNQLYGINCTGCSAVWAPSAVKLSYHIFTAVIWNYSGNHKSGINTAADYFVHNLTFCIILQSSYVCMYAHTHTHIYIHTHTRARAQACTHNQTHTCARAHTHTHTHTRTRARAHTHTHTHARACTHTHTHRMYF